MIGPTIFLGRDGKQTNPQINPEMNPQINPQINPQMIPQQFQNFNPWFNMMPPMSQEDQQRIFEQKKKASKRNGKNTIRTKKNDGYVKC